MWPGAARYRLTCRPAAARMAGRGSVWPCACGRWLPVRLPEFSLATLTFESRGAQFLFVVGLHHAKTREPLLSITGPKITIRPTRPRAARLPSLLTAYRPPRPGRRTTRQGQRAAQSPQWSGNSTTCSPR